jgi:hypothetical protein
METKIDHDYKRYKKLTTEQEMRLTKFIEKPDHWRYSHTCADWASQGFRCVTGEDIDADDIFGIETPRKTSESIMRAEENDPTLAIR